MFYHCPEPFFHIFMMTPKFIFLTQNFFELQVCISSCLLDTCTWMYSIRLPPHTAAKIFPLSLVHPQLFLFQLSATLFFQLPRPKTWSHPRSHFLFSISHIQLAHKSRPPPSEYVRNLVIFPTPCYILVQGFNHFFPELLQISLLVSLLSFSFPYNLFSTQQSECSSKMKTISCPSSFLSPMSLRIRARKLSLTCRVCDLSDLSLHLSSTCSLSSGLVLHAAPWSHWLSH